MARNGKVGDGHRNGPVKERIQVHNPKNDRWVKIDTTTHKIIDVKHDTKPFKGVTKK